MNKDEMIKSLQNEESLGFAMHCEEHIDECEELEGHESMLANWAIIQTVKYYNGVMNQDQVDMLNDAFERNDLGPSIFEHYLPEAVSMYSVEGMERMDDLIAIQEGALVH